MKKWMNLWGLAVIAMSCSGAQKTAKITNPDFLIVSQEIRSDLKPIQQERYPKQQAADLFAYMDTPSDTYCAMIWQKQPMTKDGVLAFINEEYYRTYRDIFPRSVKGLTAGCHNFFKMNDKEPYRAFRLLKQLNPQKQFDCYGVGFLQPYMMHNELSCTTLTMMDIDWRILEGHTSILQVFEENKLNPYTEISLESVNLPWVAQLGAVVPPEKMLPERKATLSELCPVDQQAMCQRHLEQYQTKKLPLQSVRLNLSPLHDIDYLSARDKTIRVVFLSNAIENIYTTKAQFNALIEKTKQASLAGTQTVFIHQAGSYKNFGLYEYQNMDGKNRIRTICKDIYPETKLERTQDFYETYFDEISETKNPPTCAPLYEKITTP